MVLCSANSKSRISGNQKSISEKDIVSVRTSSSTMVLRSTKSNNSTMCARRKVAVIYDDRMLEHKPPYSHHDERPERISCIMEKLKKRGLLEKCHLYNSEEANLKCLMAVHSSAHVNEILTISSKDKEYRDAKAESYSTHGDIYFNEGSSKAALLAAGGAIKACELVANGTHESAFAIVRPPGHHAGKDPEGFCLFNNISAGARYLLDNHQMKKILIVDWDIHHGDGTQQIFYEDAHVLYFSIHRYHTDFFPSKSGPLDDIGAGSGVGYNINVCWKNMFRGDADYIAVWDHLLIPLIKEFKPEIILISAGFDAAKNDTGQCKVSPSGFATLLSKLISFGRIVLVLEGGYNLTALSESSAACLKVLIGEENDIICDSKSLPYDSTWNIILRVREKLKHFWPIFEDEIPEKYLSRKKPDKTHEKGKHAYTISCLGS